MNAAASIGTDELRGFDSNIFLQGPRHDNMHGHLCTIYQCHLGCQKKLNFVWVKKMIVFMSQVRKFEILSKG